MEGEAAQGGLRMLDLGAWWRGGESRTASRDGAVLRGVLFGSVRAVAAGIVGEGVAGRADGARDGALRGRGGTRGGRLRRRIGGRFVQRRKHGRQPAGAEIREQIDQRVEDAEQHQADARAEEAHDHALVTPRGDALAQVREDHCQVGIGVKRDGVGHDRS
jgi:hypothetical protein